MNEKSNKQKTKLLICSALDQLLEEKPLNQISVTEIVERSSISRQTFYRHFEDIYGLLMWIFENETTGCTVFDVNKDFAESCAVSFANIAKRPSLYRQAFLDRDQLFSSRFLRNCIDYSRKQIGAKHLDESVSFAVELYWSGYLHMIKKWLSTGMKESPETMGRFCFESLPANMKEYYH